MNTPRPECEPCQAVIPNFITVHFKRFSLNAIRVNLVKHVIKRCKHSSDPGKRWYSWGSKFCSESALQTLLKQTQDPWTGSEWVMRESLCVRETECVSVCERERERGGEERGRLSDERRTEWQCLCVTEIERELVWKKSTKNEWEADKLNVDCLEGNLLKIKLLSHGTDKLLVVGLRPQIRLMWRCVLCCLFRRTSEHQRLKRGGTTMVFLYQRTELKVIFLCRAQVAVSRPVNCVNVLQGAVSMSGSSICRSWSRSRSGSWRNSPNTTPWSWCISLAPGIRHSDLRWICGPNGQSVRVLRATAGNNAAQLLIFRQTAFSFAKVYLPHVTFTFSADFMSANSNTQLLLQLKKRSVRMRQVDVDVGWLFSFRRRRGAISGPSLSTAAPFVVPSRGTCTQVRHLARVGGLSAECRCDSKPSRADLVPKVITATHSPLPCEASLFAAFVPG